MLGWTIRASPRLHRSNTVVNLHSLHVLDTCQVRVLLAHTRLVVGMVQCGQKQLLLNHNNTDRTGTEHVVRCHLYIINRYVPYGLGIYILQT